MAGKKKKEEQQEETVKAMVYKGIGKQDFLVNGVKCKFGEIYKTTDKKLYDFLINTKRIT